MQYDKFTSKFKFDSHENVRDNIEDFFAIYLDVLDVGCINDKIKT